MRMSVRQNDSLFQSIIFLPIARDLIALSKG